MSARAQFDKLQGLYTQISLTFLHSTRILLKMSYVTQQNKYFWGHSHTHASNCAF